MIRLATRSDLDSVVDLMFEFLEHTSYDKQARAADREHYKRLAYTVLKVGYIWLWVEQDEPRGLLIAVKEPMLWVPKMHILRELIWFVREPYRKNPAAGKLFIHFCRKGEELLAAGDISAYIATKMTTTEDCDLTKRGFRLTEQVYIRD